MAKSIKFNYFNKSIYDELIFFLKNQFLIINFSCFYLLNEITEFVLTKVFYYNFINKILFMITIFIVLLIL